MKQNAKSNLLFVVALTLAVLLLASCAAPAAASTSAPGASAAEGTSALATTAAEVTVAPTAAPEGKVFTAEELAKFDGKNGNPAYIAVDGVVYDVSNVPEWQGGSHWGRFTAGKDLTNEIKSLSPHGTSKLKGLPIVGTLAK